MRRLRSAAVAGAFVAAALLVAGCSQVSALAPVGGDRVTEVRYAANDQLLKAGTDVMTAPVCTMATDKAPNSPAIEPIQKKTVKFGRAGVQQ